jgi:hypothetical protein
LVVPSRGGQKMAGRNSSVWHTNVERVESHQRPLPCKNTHCIKETHVITYDLY